MGTEQNLNWEQHALNSERIKALTPDRDFRDMLSRVSQGTTPVMAHKTGSGHIQLRIKDDGIVHMASTPSDWRAVRNIESRIQRQFAEIGHSFPAKAGKMKKKGK
jgi:hypothetical protein